MEPCARLATPVLLLVVVLGATYAGPVPQASSNGSGTHHRVRRQNGEIVESIFQIPIQTLQAVSKAFTTSIQTVQRTREQFFQATRPGGATTSALTSATSGGNYNYLQQPYKPYRPQRPSSSSSSAYTSASAYSSLGQPARPNNNYVYYNYNRPRGGAASTATSQQQSHAASVAGVTAQQDGSSYRI